MSRLRASPFLFHAVRGEYPQVIITATNIDNGLLPGIRAQLNLAQVTLPARDALAGDTSHLAAQSSTLQVLVPLSSLTNALNQPNLTLSAAPDGSLSVTTTVTVAGQQIPLTGTATIIVENDALTLAVGSLKAAGLDLTPVISAAAGALAGGLSRTFPLTGLPFTITQADVSVVGGDVVVTASTGPVLLSQIT